MLRSKSFMPHQVVRWLFLLFASVILFAPAIAMQFTSEVNWGHEDFGAMGLILFIAGVALEVSARHSKTDLQRGLAVGFIVFVFLAIWAELAVGIF